MDKQSSCLPLEIMEENIFYEKQREFEILAMAMEHASDSIIITDRYNNIIKVNNSFLKTFGYCEQDVIGRNTNFLSSTKHDPAF